MRTTSISLIREHTEAIRPPRALWVPFELGRPLGPPGDPAFQMDVLRSALALLDEPSTPVLRDYPHDAPRTDDGGVWACPLPAPVFPPAATQSELRQEQLLAELRSLRPWYAEAASVSGRTAFGVSGLAASAVDDAARALCAVAANEMPTAPDGATSPMPMLIRLLADDLKAFYFEAAAAQPGSRRPSAQELNHWLFHETVLGGVLYDVRDSLLRDDDPRVQLAGRFLVPAAFSHRA